MVRGSRRNVRVIVDDLGMQRTNAIGSALCRGLYITAAYWFTASTSFANPAVTIARAFSDTFAGIAPAGVAAFIAAQFAGALAAVALAGWLWRDPIAEMAKG